MSESALLPHATTPVGSGWFRVFLAVAQRPGLWRTAVTQGWKLAPRRWWRSWPPLPLPAPEYLRFRALTAYGDPNRIPDPHDVITWLAWAKAWNVTSRSTPRTPDIPLSRTAAHN